MKILLTINKTLSNGKNTWIDGGYYNVYEPLKDLGHDVYFWDTVNPEEPNIKKVIDKFKPDIIFACLTGDLGLTPAEPIAFEEISRQTEKGNIKTFNWFCELKSNSDPSLFEMLRAIVANSFFKFANLESNSRI